MNWIAEKYIHNKVEGNKITRVHEFKDASHVDWENLVDDYDDYISDDWEDQMDAGLYCDRNGDITTIDVTMLFDYLNERCGSGLGCLCEDKDEDEYLCTGKILIDRYEEAFKEFEGFIVSYTDENTYRVNEE